MNTIPPAITVQNVQHQQSYSVATPPRHSRRGSRFNVSSSAEESMVIPAFSIDVSTNIMQQSSTPPIDYESDKKSMINVKSSK